MDYVKQYEDYNTNYDNIINILSEILEAGEITQGSQERLEEAYVDYNQSYSDTITLFQGKKNTSINERIDKIESIKLNANIKDIVTILTNNGEKTTLYLDEDGVLYIDGEKIPELKQTKLIVDEQNGKIESLVSDGFVEDADGNKVKLKVLYSTLKQDMNGFTSQVGEISGIASNAKDTAQAALDKYSQIEQNVERIQSTVANLSLIHI